MATNPLPHVLKLVEGVTHQQTAILVDPDELELVGQALEQLLRDPQELIESGRLAPASVSDFWELGECLYTLDSAGELSELQPWIRLYQGHEQVPTEAPLRFERRPLPGGILGPNVDADMAREVMIAELTLDRRDCLYNRDWRAFHQRKLRQHADEVDAFIESAAVSYLGEERTELAMSRRDVTDRAVLLRAAAQRIFRAPFELYSRFIGRRRLIKDGITTIRNIVAGHGGACSEKAQATKFIADALELPCEYILCGPETPGELPIKPLLEILETFEVQHANTAQAFWNHVAVLVEIDGKEVLVDASGGNIPFLWETGEDLEAILDRRGPERRGVLHRYVVGNDELHYHRSKQTLPEKLLFALELGWADPHIDLVQALDDELGLMTMPDLWLGASAYRNEEERQTLRSWYLDKWLEPGHVRGVLFSDDLEASDDPLALELRDKYPSVPAAASEGRPYMEERLEEANPGSQYRVELVLVGRREVIPGE